MHPSRLLTLALALMSAAVLCWTPQPARSADGLPSPAGWPLAGRVRVAAGFDPPAQRWQAGHRGVDLAGGPGQPVLAAAAGRVSFAGRVAGQGVVVVDHGSVRTTYQPVAGVVVAGQPVSRGSVLGALTAGGHCPGCLHWGLRRGSDYLDPLRLAPDASAGPVRLMPAAQRSVARRRAAERAAAADRAQAQLNALAADVPPGPSGRRGFARPVSGPISSGFGLRLHPVLRVWKLHDGTDFAAPCGTPIRAPYAGRVRQVSRHPAYGNRLLLDHGLVSGRRVRTSYNHAARFVVPAGARVVRGQVLGFVGSTGYSTGCHLHLSLWLDGRLANPMSW